MKKLLEILGWFSGAVGAIMMLLGVIAVFAGKILWNHWWANYFYPGGVFVVLGIFLFLGVMICQNCNKKE